MHSLHKKCLNKWKKAVYTDEISSTLESWVGVKKRKEYTLKSLKRLWYLTIPLFSVSEIIVIFLNHFNMKQTCKLFMQWWIRVSSQFKVYL